MNAKGIDVFLNDTDSIATVAKQKLTDARAVNQNKTYPIRPTIVFAVPITGHPRANVDSCFYLEMMDKSFEKSAGKMITAQTTAPNKRKNSVKRRIGRERQLPDGGSQTPPVLRCGTIVLRKLTASIDIVPTALQLLIDRQNVKSDQINHQEHNGIQICATSVHTIADSKLVTIQKRIQATRKCTNT